MFDKKDKPVRAVPKTVPVTLSFEMDEKTAKLFLQSSIERVINTTLRVLEHANSITPTPDAFENAGINEEDWLEWKPVICSMWSAMHDAVYRKMADMEPSDRTFELRKGDV
jgi:hypothetical protein